jgi:polar amino acid transport system substrate-binding protein
MKMNRLRFMFMFLAAAMAAPATAESLSERGKEDGLRVAFYNFKPYAYINDEGKLVGEQVDILRRTLAEMGLKVGSETATEWGALIPGLKAGRFDVVAAGMFVTPKRCAEVRFSEPTFGIKQALAVLKKNPAGVSDYESIRDKKLKIGAVSGSAQVGYAQTAGIADANIVQLPDNPTGIAALRAGRINAWAVSAPGVRDIVAGVPEQDLESTPVFDTIAGEPAVSHGAFAFRSEDGGFVDRFDGALAAFIGTPAHIRLMESHGMSADELPVLSTAQLCGN